MSGPLRHASLVFLLIVNLSACSQKPAASPARPSILVTSSLLERIAREICGEGDGAAATIRSLVPPGSCPGHFDLSPRARPALENAALIIRHDFQKALEERIARLATRAPEVLAVEAQGGLLVPDRYADLARRVAECLAKRFPERRAEFDGRLAALTERVAGVGAAAKARGARWAGRKAIVSVHQRAFAAWLGLDVVGELRRPEDVGPQELERLLALKPDGIVANLQEGTQAAEALGTRLGVPVIVFSNFPDVEGYGRGYDGLLAANLDRLDRAWTKP